MGTWDLEGFPGYGVPNWKPPNIPVWVENNEHARPWLSYVPFTRVLPGEVAEEMGGGETDWKRLVEGSDTDALRERAGGVVQSMERQLQLLTQETARILSAGLAQDTAGPAQDTAGLAEYTAGLAQEVGEGGGDEWEDDSDEAAMKALYGPSYKWEGRAQVVADVQKKQAELRGILEQVEQDILGTPAEPKKGGGGGRAQGAEGGVDRGDGGGFGAGENGGWGGGGWGGGVVVGEAKAVIGTNSEMSRL
jgi:hypothetical protein